MNRVRSQILWDGILFAFALASGAAVLAVRKCAPETSAYGEAASLFGSMSREQPRRVGLSRDGRTVQVANRSSDSDTPHWYAEKPWKRAGDPVAIDAAMSALRGLQVVRQLESGPRATVDRLRAYGLDQPRCSWQLEFDGTALALNIGANAPSPRGGTYVELNDSARGHQVYVVQGDVSRLDSYPEELLEARLLPYVPSDFRELGIDSDHNHGKYQCDATHARWFEAEGQHRRVDREQIGELLLGLTNLKADRLLVSADTTLRNLDDRFAAVTLGLDSSKVQVRVELHRNCPDHPGLSLLIVSGADDTLACANVEQLANMLDAQASSWVDTHLFSLRTDEVESLALQLEGRSLTLEREGSAFLLRGLESHPIDIDTGNEVVQKLVSTHGTLATTRSVSASDFDPNTFVELRSAVVGLSEHYEERVIFGPIASNGERWVKRISDSAAMRIDSKTDSLLRLEGNLIRSRIIVNVEASRVQDIELSSRGRRLRWVSEKGGSLRPEPGPDLPLDSGDVELLRRHLAGLRAQRWLKKPSSFARDKPTYLVSFAIMDGDNTPRRYLLHIAVNTSKEVAAWLEETNDYFEPELELVDLVKRLLH